MSHIDTCHEVGEAGVFLLVQALRVRGDAELFEELYPGLRRFAAATAPPEVDPDDLVQEAVARVLRLHTLSELDEPGAYLRRTIANLASNHRRSFARWRTAVSRVGRTEEGRAAEYDSDLADLMRVPPEGRAVLYLVEVEGRSYAEVAELLGISEEAARTRSFRARQRLRLDLQGEQ
jgi:RNA polymerase sigma factor (sigma-70 family)